MRLLLRSQLFHGVVLLTLLTGGAVAVNAAGAPRPQDVFVNPKAATDAAMWISIDDYPKEALRARAEGTTAVALSIDATGKVSGCTLLSSSGSPALDDATCRALTARAQFIPARDRHGDAVASSVTRRVNWKMPVDSGTIEPEDLEGLLASFGATSKTIDLSVDLTEDDVVQHCSVHITSSAAASADDPCRGLEGHTLRVHPDSGEAATARHVVLRITSVVTPAKIDGSGPTGDRPAPN